MPSNPNFGAAQQDFPGVAVPHSRTGSQTERTITTCQIRYRSHLCDHRRTEQL